MRWVQLLLCSLRTGEGHCSPAEHDTTPHQERGEKNRDTATACEWSQTHPRLYSRHWAALFSIMPTPRFLASTKVMDQR